MRKHFFFLAIIISVFSDCQDIKKVNLEGHWRLSGDSDIVSFACKQDIFLSIDKHSFVNHCTYQINDDKLQITRNKDGYVLEKTISRLEKDTLILSDSTTYYRLDSDIEPLSYYEKSDLIDLETNRLLSEVERYYHSIHFYKSDKGTLQLRLGDKICGLKEIPLFLETSHRRQPEVLLFLGKDISLTDLQSLYFPLMLGSQQKLWIATKRKGFSDYHVIRERIDIWYNDLEDYQKINNGPPLPPPPPEILSKKNYLQGAMENVIRINTVEDFKQVDGLAPNQRYVISIDKKLATRDYFKLKEKLKPLWKSKRIKYFTEIQ